MKQYALELEGVSKVYAGKWGRGPSYAIHDVSLSIESGESVGFIGHNGAGKSTSIRIALGLQQASTGTVRLRGGSPLEPDYRQGVAYVPENPLLYDYLRPIELLRMACRLHGTDAGRIESQCQTWLQRFGVADIGRKRIGELSKGMTQRVALAFAMVSEPKVLILDEPLSGLDPMGRKEVVDILSEYRHGGGTLWFSSHVLTDVERLADRFAFIHKGRIRVLGRPETILRDGAGAYEVLAVAGEGLPGFEYRREGVQCGLVDPDRLEQCVAEIGRRGGHVLTIQSTNTLEKAYLRFVATEEARAN